MANITAADVNKLRQITGAGMMDCKKALTETEGDFDKAIDYLRKKGQKVANSRADREASEGIVLAKIQPDGKRAVAIMLNCETDFVAKNQDYINFANAILDVAANNAFNSLEELLNATLNDRSIADNITDMIGKIGEKLALSHYEFVDGEKAFAYNHHGNRLSAIIAFNKNVNNLDQIGHEIAMQIAAMNPIAIDNENVSQDVINRELEIGKEQARLEGKPENMLEKIAQGKLQKFFKESTLLNQEFIKDNKKTIRQYLAETDKDLKINAFRRLQLGA